MVQPEAVQLGLAAQTQALSEAPAPPTSTEGGTLNMLGTLPGADDGGTA